MTYVPTRKSGCPIVARGFVAGGLGGALLGWLILLTMLAPTDPVVAGGALLVAAPVGAVIGATVGMLSGIVLAIRETDGRTDRVRRRDAALTSAAPFVLITVLVAPTWPTGWWAGLAIAALSAAAASVLAPYTATGPDLCR